MHRVKFWTSNAWSLDEFISPKLPLNYTSPYHYISRTIKNVDTSSMPLMSAGTENISKSRVARKTGSISPQMQY